MSSLGVFTQTAVAMVKLINKMTTPSILSAIKKTQVLLTRGEKWKCVGIAGFALSISILEVITASIIVVFAQVLNQPEVGQKYLSQIGFNGDISPGKVIFYIAVICGIVYFIKNLVAAVEVFYQNFSIQKINYQFKNRLLHRYAQASYESYLTRNSALGVSVVAGDAEQMFSVGMLALASILSESIVFLCLISMIVWMNPSLALMVFSISAVIGLVVTKQLLPQFYRWGQKLQESALYSTQNLLQFFHAFKEIVLLGKRDAFIEAYRFHSYKKSRVQAFQTATNALPRIVIEILFVGLFVATTSYLCLKDESRFEMLGILGGYLYAGFRLMPGLNRIINQLNNFKLVIPSIERAYNEYNAFFDEENYMDAADFCFEKQISISEISFRYPNTVQDALSHVSLKIKKGECVGIAGETGSGKSTLIDVILGLLKPYDGNVLIDDKYPANAYQWHEKVGYVPQSIYLVDDSIEANIAFGEKTINVDNLRLKQSIKDAQLSKMIEQLPEGIKTIVGERGIRLSGGERQRIAIARALYRNPEVLIFDEATSALDGETESRLMDTIRMVSRDRTVIMVAHRLTTLKDCHRIILMKKGIVEKITSFQDMQGVNCV